MKEAGVGIIFTIDHIDTRDQDGELRLTIMASLAQEESRKTSERVKWGQKRRMEQGVVFGRDMLGYTVKNGILSIQEEEALIVKIMPTPASFSFRVYASVSTVFLAKRDTSFVKIRLNLPCKASSIIC